MLEKEFQQAFSLYAKPVKSIPRRRKPCPPKMGQCPYAIPSLHSDVKMSDYVETKPFGASQPSTRLSTESYLLPCPAVSLLLETGRDTVG